MEGLHIAVRVHVRCFRIEACDKLPLLNGCEILLTLDNNQLMGPDRIR
jgi:hypothetical protein